MCTNKRFIKNKFTGQRFLVSCGHCPACRQEHADRRALKIRNSVGKDEYAVFVTFTYANDHIPYIAKSDLIMAVSKNKFQQIEIPIYRDKYVKSCRISRKSFKRKDFETSQIDTFCIENYDLFQLASDSYKLPYLRNGNPNKVGVLYYQDMQLYFKRLRKTLQQRGFDYKLKYFCCGEYGSTTMRPHFHVLFILPLSAAYSPFASAVASCWPFDDNNLTRRNIEIAKSAASYLSSYVNCTSSVSPVLLASKQTRPLYRHSLHFGLSLDSFALPQILAAFERRDMFYDSQSYQGQVLTSARFPYPKYVIHRFFPKWKGYCRLADHEIESIFIRPSNIYRFKERCFLDDIDCRMIVTHIENKKRQALRLGMDEFYYAYVASRIWNLRSSCIYKEQFSDLHDYVEQFELYDNVEDYLKGDLLAPSLDPLVQYLPHFEADPNLFRSNTKRHSYLTDRFFKHDKSLKARHLIFEAANINNPNWHF